MRQRAYQINLTSIPEIKKYDLKYNMHVQMLRQVSDESRDICISRIPGEDFSLNVEVVRTNKDILLFDKFTD